MATYDEALAKALQGDCSELNAMNLASIGVFSKSQAEKDHREGSEQESLPAEGD